ncbi:MAG: hypothetical protein J6K38_08805 [Alistipes sp.]|nr:hypothetical protein [Alistipes sp.]
MEDKKVIRCFIASPGDTAEEREICEKVFSDINAGIGTTYGFILQSLRWENDVHPGLGNGGQEVINSQIKDKYDLFIGIMYTKFGTPTEHAESGTEEEFNIAYERALQQKNMEIMFYFNDAALNPSKIDIEQYQKVTNFRTNVVQQKCMYSMYNGIQDFEQKLRKHLNLYFHEHYLSADKNTAEKLTRTSFILEERLNSALQLFSGQPRIWIDPIISSKQDISIHPDENYEDRVDVNTIIDSPTSLIISAPPQFGLTCLSHYMIYEAWRRKKLWIYVDAKKVKAHNVSTYINNEFVQLGIDIQTNIECIILDEWCPSENGALKKLKAICDAYSDIPIILMRTLEESKFLKERQEEIKINREFTPLFLLPMTRNQVRTFVQEYNQETHIADDEVLLDKVVNDLATLNIHRTPHNCLTLLKVDEKKFDNNPVNRSQMLEDVLYVLFEFTDLPRYDSKPDVKDCQFVLGCFCEILIKENRFCFTKDDFLKRTREYSASNMIDIDVKIVFDILYQNNIISDTDNQLTFKSAFWLLYFAARRMHVNPDFAEYIFKSKKYLDYPEIIEFYTGIDRNRNDALNILLKDIQETCDVVFTRISIPDTINPYRLARWHPDIEHIEKMQQELSDTVMSSGLPEAIKDKYQDFGYNQLTPYNQNVVIHDFFEEYYVYNLMQEIKSSSRALRNSDYANVEIKKQLLDEVLRGWLQISKVLFALVPILATKGRAEYGGAGFLLSDNFGETEEVRARNILFVILTNVVGFFKDDIYSSKISPLLYDAFEHPTSPLIKQQLALLFIICRPRNWYNYIGKYIISLSKDSFFLFEILNEMRAQYKFGFIEENDSQILSTLIRKSLAKHMLGINNPSPGQMKQIPNSYMPKREEDTEHNISNNA